MNRISRAIIASSIALSSIAGTLGVSAQPATTSNTFTSEVAGEEIELGQYGMFIPDDYAVVEENGVTFEYILVASDTTDFELAFVDGEYTPEQYLESTIDLYASHYAEWEVVAQDSNADTGWFVADAENNVIYANYEVDAYGDVDLGYVQFSKEGTLESDIQWAQESITVGGDPILADVEAAEVVAAHEGAEDGTSETSTGVTRTTRGSRDASTTETATEEATSETSTGVTRTTRGSRDASTTETATAETGTNETETTTGAAVETTSQLTGDVISLGETGEGSFMEDQYQLNESPGFAEEFVWFTNQSANYELVFVSGDTDGVEYTDITLGNMQEYYDTWELVDSDQTEEAAWFLAEAEVGGTPLVVYYEYAIDAYDDIDLVYMQFSYSDGVQSDMEWVQDNVTIGGEPILTGTDATEIGDMLGLSGSTQTNGEDPLQTDGTAAATDWAALGLVSETEWVSPQYDSSVTWEPATWEFPDDYEYAVISNTDAQYDTLTLQTTDGMGYVYITIDDTYGNTTQDLVDWYNSPQYAESISNPMTILDSRVNPTTGGIVYESTNTLGQPIMVIVDVQILDDGTAIYTQLTAAPEQLPGVLESYATEVNVNGELVEQTFTPADIEGLLGN